MLVWMRGLVGASKMFYTENQREYFFRKVDELYQRYCIQLAGEVLPEDKCAEAEKRIIDGESVDDWWDEYVSLDVDKDSVIYEKVYRPLFVDLVNNHYYTYETYMNAPSENPAEWYKCSTVKSLLHEFINDEEDPYEIIVPLSDEQIAYLSYAICSIYVRFISRNLQVNEEDADYMLNLLYCGEFAQNDWLNHVFNERESAIRPRVTDLFLYTMLERKYSLGMKSVLFSEFLHKEVTASFYRAVYNARHDIMERSFEYWAANADNEWTPAEMESFYQYIVSNVKLYFDKPHVEWYMED